MQNVICADPQAFTDTAGRIRIPSPCERIQLMAMEMAQSMYQARKEALLADFEAA